MEPLSPKYILKYETHKSITALGLDTAQFSLHTPMLSEIPLRKHGFANTALKVR